MNLTQLVHPTPRSFLHAVFPCLRPEMRTFQVQPVGGKIFKVNAVDIVDAVRDAQAKVDGPIDWVVEL